MLQVIIALLLVGVAVAAWMMSAAKKPDAKKEEPVKEDKETRKKAKEEEGLRKRAKEKEKKQKQETLEREAAKKAEADRVTREEEAKVAKEKARAQQEKEEKEAKEKEQAKQAEAEKAVKAAKAAKEAKAAKAEKAAKEGAAAAAAAEKKVAATKAAEEEKAKQAALKEQEKKEKEQAKKAKQAEAEKTAKAKKSAKEGATAAAAAAAEKEEEEAAKKAADKKAAEEEKTKQAALKEQAAKAQAAKEQAAKEQAAKEQAAKEQETAQKEKAANDEARAKAEAESAAAAKEAKAKAGQEAKTKAAEKAAAEQAKTVKTDEKTVEEQTKAEEKAKRVAAKEAKALAREKERRIAAEVDAARQARAMREQGVPTTAQPINQGPPGGPGGNGGACEEEVGACDTQAGPPPPKPPPGAVGTCNHPHCNPGMLEALIFVRVKLDYKKIFDEKTMTQKFPLMFNKKHFTYAEDGCLVNLLMCSHGNIIGIANVCEKHSVAEDFMFLRWRLPRAPRMIYTADACLLERICLEHEFNFFANTQFLQLPKGVHSVGGCKHEPICKKDRFLPERLHKRSVPPRLVPNKMAWKGVANAKDKLKKLLLTFKENAKEGKIALEPYMKTLHGELTKTNLEQWKAVAEWKQQEEVMKLPDVPLTKFPPQTGKDNKCWCRDAECDGQNFEHSLRLTIECSRDLIACSNKYTREHDGRWLGALSLLLGASLKFPGPIPKECLEAEDKMNGNFGTKAAIVLFDHGLLPFLALDLARSVFSHDYMRAQMILGVVVNFGIHTVPVIQRELQRLNFSHLVTIASMSPNEELKKLGLACRDSWIQSKAWNKPVCEGCKKPMSERMICSRCKLGIYCSQKCQVATWKMHKMGCKPFPKPVAKPAAEDDKKAD